ncbi:CoA-transferase [Streptomyces sp. ODS28]|uniref:CoA-transferase subunit beta n=1 Tax=Streptomyces sp. ODS28 TaxID=3136688 RepID=UPI0031EBFF5C
MSGRHQAEATRAEVCVVACAEAWRGDGEILAAPMGAVPRVGALLARRTFSPDLLLTDGEAALVDADGRTEGWLPYGKHLELTANGKRHVMMGASQLDRYGNQNISCIGDWQRPDRQLLGSRGAPANTLNNPVSYWVPRHSARVFVAKADVVSGVGYDRAAQAGPSATRFHGLRRVVTDLAVLDFGTPDHRMRLVSVHPGVTAEEVRERTGFALEPGHDDVPPTRKPTAEELRLIREELDPENTREAEVPS